MARKDSKPRFSGGPADLMRYSIRSRLAYLRKAASAYHTKPGDKPGQRVAIDPPLPLFHRVQVADLPGLDGAQGVGVYADGRGYVVVPMTRKERQHWIGNMSPWGRRYEDYHGCGGKLYRYVPGRDLGPNSRGYDRALTGSASGGSIPSGFRWKGWSNEVMEEAGHWRTARDAMGWYTDNFQNNTLRGFVVQLPGRKGQARYYAGTAYSDHDGIIIWLDQPYSEAIDAARAANDNAEAIAELDREEDARDIAEQRIGDRKADIRATREEFHALAMELATTRSIYNGTPGLPKLCAAIHEKLAALREQVRDYVKEINELRDNYWSAVE